MNAITTEAETLSPLFAMRKKLAPVLELALAISTGHVSQETAEHLDSKTVEVLSYPLGKDGWMIYAEELPGTGPIPADLEKVLAFAKSLGCVWLLLDCDAPAIDELPTFDW